MFGLERNRDRIRAPQSSALCGGVHQLRKIFGQLPRTIRHCCQSY